MPLFEIISGPATVTPDRTCGSCTACCTHLGVEELKKYSGQKCPKLLPPSAGAKRCSIYSTRPKACAGYQCMWLSGFGPESLRPSRSGILITPYPSDDKPGHISLTVNVFNIEKAEPHIEQLIGDLITLPFISEVRLILSESRKANLFKNGLIYNCDLLHPEPGDYEALTFCAHEPPVGRYLTYMEPT